MLDTIKVLTHRLLHRELVEEILAGNPRPLPDWVFKSHHSQRSVDSPVEVVIEGWHEPTGMYVSGDDQVVRNYTASLPRVLHGFNGVQLKTDAENGAAAEATRAIIDQIAFRSIPTETIVRLDIALNLDHLEPERLIQALWNARHPSVRRETERYSHGCVRLPGIKVAFQAYWKRPPQRSGMREKAWHTPKTLRLEVQLKSREKIKEFVGDFSDFLPSTADLYRGFRKFMLQFPPAEQLGSKCTMASLLAVCEAQQVRLPGGQCPLDWHRQSVSRSGHTKMRSKVARAVNHLVRVDWAELLPADQIPTSVDVLANGDTRPVSATTIGQWT